MKRVGIFDPAFKNTGHFIAFDRYIAQLLDDADVQLVFFDTNGLLRDAYQKDSFAHAPIFVELPMRSEHGGRIAHFKARFSYWRSVFARMEAENLDFLLITAEARDPLMYVVRPRIPYGVLLLYPYSYMFSRARSFSQYIYAYLYSRFVRNASLRASTSEPPVLADIQRRMGIHDISWLPNLPVIQKTREGAARKHKFLTLGTILRSKNHLFALRAFTEHALPYEYHIAGAPVDSVGEEVQAMVEHMQEAGTYAVSGTFSYLSPEEYESFLAGAQYMVFPYDFARGDISSQVLHDSFSYQIPIIAPAIEPFKWYVEKYGIGFLYKEGDSASFAETLHKAAQTNSESFATRFAALLKEHTLAHIRAQFREKLRAII